MKEASHSWTLSAALQTPTTLYTLLCIEDSHIQTGIWIRIPNIQYLQKGKPFKLLDKEMDYLTKVLQRSSHPNWFLKKTNNRPHMDQATNQETTMGSFVTVPYIQGLSKEFRRILKDTEVQIIFKVCHTLKTVNAP